ncbi:hypothetical protein [Nostoc sp. FACHB-145]|uniref:hypothetical protein n=1 Tax=Nostoc sp. FACHB-145 TaxID=2692836 RepID=UPI001687AAD7|nr:hypothetical protein [Nostoc sp. FACHB-145]MBD2472381.1 hypothetical protein [Nostoc sp. FACHB-145]
MNKYTVAYALNLWKKSKKSQKVDANFEKYLSLSLRKFVFTQFDEQAKNLTAKQFYIYCQQVELEQVKDALTIFDIQTKILIEQGKLSENTRNNYRSALARFITWIEEQIWWKELFLCKVTNTDVAPFREKVAPKPTGGKLPFYGLRLDDLPKNILEQIEEFSQFRLSGGKNIRLPFIERRKQGEGRAFRPKIDTVKPATFKKDEQAILRFFGWYRQNYPNDELDLKLLTDVGLLDDYTYWMTTTRNVSHSTGVTMVGTGIAIAKWLNFKISKRRNWLDIPIILELQDLQSAYTEIYEQEKKEDLDKKWASKKLTHEQARQVVQFLQMLCAPNYGKHDLETGEFLSHGTRNDSAVARAWQTYLIVKFLVYCPVRQEEIRNLKLGETLFRKEDKQGNPYYEAKITNHKRSSVTAKPRHYRLPAILTADLEIWIYKWRPLIEESVKTLDGWIDFWGYGGGKVERIAPRLEAAKQGIVGEKVTNSLDVYIQQQEGKLQGAKNRIAAWEIAKNNLESHNYLFFILGKHEPESFGTPHYVGSVWKLVIAAIARGTKTLFGEERWTNPHALRHIAEAHIRVSGKAHIAAAFGALIGHSKEMGDEYASQVLSEYDLTKNIVDDWWE